MLQANGPTIRRAPLIHPPNPLTIATIRFAFPLVDWWRLLLLLIVLRVRAATASFERSARADELHTPAPISITRIVFAFAHRVIGTAAGVIRLKWILDLSMGIAGIGLVDGANARLVEVALFAGLPALSRVVVDAISDDCET